MSATTWGALVLGALLVDFAVRRGADLLNLAAFPVSVPDELGATVDEADLDRTHRYLGARTRLAVASATFDLALVLAFWWVGGFELLDDWARGVARSWSLEEVGAGAIYLGILIAARAVLSLPFRAWSTFVVEERFGFNRTSAATFAADLLRVAGLALVLGGPVLVAVLWFFIHAGTGAWVYAWLAVTAAALAIQFLAPRIVLPLFNDFEPVEDEDLRTAVLEIAEGADFPVEDVQVMDGSKRSTKSNAFFVGLGSNRRIALFDTLVERHGVAELVAIVAHEIGHWVRRHVPQRMGVAVIHTGALFLLLSFVLQLDGLYAAFYVDRPSVHTGLVFFALLVAPLELLVSMPTMALSRRHEFQADRFAADATGDPEAMIAALRKLASDNLSHPAPHPFWILVNASHPPATARIRALRRNGKRHEPAPKPGAGSGGDGAAEEAKRRDGSGRDRGTRRAGSALLALVVVGLLASVPAGCTPEAAEADVVVVYLVDALRPDHLEPYGYGRPTSPELRAFRERAVLYDNAYTTAPWTKPAVASLLTSRHPSTHRARERNDRLSSTALTAAEIFSDHGFETVAFSTNPNVSELFGFEQGFELFVPMKRPGAPSASPVPQPVPAAAVIDAVRRFLDHRSGDRPLFLYVHTMDPHSPYAPEPDDLARVAPDHRGPREVEWSDRLQVATRDVVNLYDAEIRAADRAFGALLDLLAERRLLRRAAIVFTADHGEEFREHGELGHGKRLWEESVRVPLLIRYPGDVDAGTTMASPTSLVDILPTLMRIAGISTDDYDLQGRDLGSGGPQSHPDGRRSVYMEESRDEIELYASRRGPWKAILQLRPERRFSLFDLSEDPGEARNVAAREPELAERLESELAIRAERSAAGYWLVALAGPDPRRLTGRIRARGRIVEVETRGVDADDLVVLDDGGLRFDLELSPPPGGTDRYFARMDPRKGFRFTTEPPGAALTLKVEIDGRPLPARLLRLGAEPRADAGESSSPFRVASAPELPGLEDGLPVRRSAASLEAEVVLRYVPTPQRVEIDEATEERLRALGYQ